MTSEVERKCEAVLADLDPLVIDAYERHLPLLIDYVGRTFSKRTDLSDLIGSNSLETLIDQQEQYGCSLLYEFRLGNAITLIRSHVRMYHTYIARGFSPDYFAASLAIWRDAIADFIDAPHAAPLQAFFTMLLDAHPALLSMPIRDEEQTTVIASARPYFQRYLQAVLEPSSHQAIQVVESYIRTVEDIYSCWSYVIQPAMYEIGRLWSEGEITVGQEHLATSITQRVMSIYYPMILSVPRDQGTIIVAASPSELHEIGPRMVADFLELRGWDVYYTGANTPEDSLIDMIAHSEVDFVCISTTLPSNLLRVAALIRKIRQSTAGADVSIIVGGQAYAADLAIGKKIGADYFAHSIDDMVDYLRKTRSSRDVA